MKMPMYDAMIVSATEPSQARLLDPTRRHARERAWTYSGKPAPGDVMSDRRAPGALLGVISGLPIGLTMWAGIVWGTVSLLHLV